MQIKTQRLTLEPLGTKFLVSTHAYASDPELTRLMVFLPTDDLAETERYLKKCEAEAAKERPQFYETAVLLDGRHIGSVSAYLEENGTAWYTPLHRALRQREFRFTASNAEAGTQLCGGALRQKKPRLRRGAQRNDV